MLASSRIVPARDCLLRDAGAADQIVETVREDLGCLLCSSLDALAVAHVGLDEVNPVVELGLELLETTGGGRVASGGDYDTTLIFELIRQSILAS